MSLSLYLVIHLYANLNIVRYYYSVNFLCIPRSSITKSYFAHLLHYLLAIHLSAFTSFFFFVAYYIYRGALRGFNYREHGIYIYKPYPLLFFLYSLFFSLDAPSSRRLADWRIYAMRRDLQRTTLISHFWRRPRSPRSQLIIARVDGRFIALFNLWCNPRVSLFSLPLTGAAPLNPGISLS